MKINWNYTVLGFTGEPMYSESKGADGRIIRTKATIGPVLLGPDAKKLEAIVAEASPGDRDRFAALVGKIAAGGESIIDMHEIALVYGITGRLPALTCKAVLDTIDRSISGVEDDHADRVERPSELDRQLHGRRGIFAATARDAIDRIQQQRSSTEAAGVGAGPAPAGAAGERDAELERLAEHDGDASDQGPADNGGNGGQRRGPGPKVDHSAGSGRGGPGNGVRTTGE